MADGEIVHGVSHVAVECRPAVALCVIGRA